MWTVAAAIRAAAFSATARGVTASWAAIWTSAGQATPAACLIGEYRPILSPIRAATCCG